MTGAASPAFEVRFDDVAFREDLAHATEAYLPASDGAWGMVFSHDFDGLTPVLVYLAFGTRHPRRPWQPSVYDVAHRRLHPGS